MPTFMGVSPEGTDSSPRCPRCPHCAALVRHDSPWCSLCYADLRAAPQRPAASSMPLSSALSSALSSSVLSSSAASDRAAFDPLTAPLALLEGTGAWEPAPAADVASSTPVLNGWPCLHCGAKVPLDESACATCGKGFLEGAIADEPVLGRLGNVAASKQNKAFIMVGGSIGLVALLLGLMYVVGAVF